MAVSASGDRDAADADGLGTYQVHYAEYYEPYVIMAAVRLRYSETAVAEEQECPSMYVCM